MSVCDPTRRRDGACAKLRGTGHLISTISPTSQPLLLFTHLRVRWFQVVEEQNKMLRRALETQQKEAEEESTRLKKELDDLKESVIEHKNKLQKEFRHRLQVSFL